MNAQLTNFEHTPLWDAPQEKPVNHAVSEHKWYLSERLGRDVGQRVADLDYRLNIQPKSANDTPWFFRLLERLAVSHGARALAQIQFTTRSLYSGTDRRTV